ncbi:uncharacterized protein SPPG_01635 [Spizellomyces punctatus DAOM BR117]|uniref:THO complex subunit 5 n=1 Tax=Spizellomyces punctatus (strain DAOM BR117) TaxID=645134 RepID=A0A0L0HT00_SPIPD|nr:uncharacterized protein SPPG_01635 [Spizellomyces punctatus DAOM BR117]KND04202.1 hypothetical protein SPPG_01635 [Spizellomyces punctatus DAOM BR117]|eukprot:XP_016612241.1 hypothetical protein SPPG_01635 [Spizellomyces punctatus DAOM BR117]
MAAPKRKRDDDASRREDRLPHIQAITSVCKQIREEVGQDAKRRRTPTTVDKPITEHPSLSIRTSVQFMELLQLQRAAYSHTIARKQATQEAKHSMDRVHLDLQNINYEIRHLEKEIAECEELETEYQKIKLIPEPEYYAIAMEKGVNVEDPHELMLSRLNHELDERTRLVQEEKELAKELEEVLEENQKELIDLEKLDKELSDSLKATLPLQTRLGITNSERREAAELAKLLPTALYVLYKHAVGYSETFENNLTVEISGDTELAAVLIGEPAESDRSLQPESAHQRSPSEEEMEGEQEPSGEQKESVGHLDRSKTYYRRHPLSVCLTVTETDTAGAPQIVKLSFSYLTTLKIVVVSSEFVQPVDYIPAGLICTNLFPGDVGNESPNPANAFLGSDSSPFRFDTTAANGNAYTWAQSICGIEFPSHLGNYRLYLTKLPSLLRNRVRSLKGLAKQVADVAAAKKGTVSGWKLIEMDAYGCVYEVTIQSADLLSKAEFTLPPATNEADIGLTIKQEGKPE